MSLLNQFPKVIFSFCHGLRILNQDISKKKKKVDVEISNSQTVKLSQILAFAVASRVKRQLRCQQTFGKNESEKNWENFVTQHIQHCDNTEGFAQVSQIETEKKLLQQNDL